jgi:multidrug resistance efflux pump
VAWIGSGMAVKVKRERPDQRRHHRVTAPLFVGVDGTRLRATDWSLGGLRLEKQFQLTLPFQGFDVSFEVKAEVVRTGGETKTVAVRFTEIGERERELMQHFIEELVRGSMSDVEDTIQRIDVPVTPAKLEPDSKAIPANMPVRRWPVKTVVMTSVYGVIGLIIFGYAGLLGYTNFFRMEIQTAVISAPVETVIAQSDGQVQWVKVKPGDEVKSGDVVITVVDNRLEREIELADIEVQERKAQLLYLKQRQTDELDKLRGFATVEMKNVKQSKVELDGLQEQLTLAQQQYDRLKGLADKGYATESKLDEARKQVITLKAQFDSHSIELSSRVELADQNIGKRLFNGTNLIGEAADAEDKVHLAEHQMKLAEKKAQAILKERARAAVTAPFDGTVIELPHIDKGSVRKGDAIAVIEQRVNRRVTAFLNQDEILKVGLGDEALLFVPALGETLKGRVREIDRTSGFISEQQARQLPGYQWRGAHDRSAKIMIDFDEPEKVKDADKYRAGMPVVVVFEQRSTNSLLSTLKKKFSVSM